MKIVTRRSLTTRSRRFIVLFLLEFVSFVSASAQIASPQNKTIFKGNPKILIVVLSRTGNTRAVADMIEQQVGGRLVILSLVTPYPEAYRAQVDQVARENETGYLPPLATKIDSMSGYDIVFVGFPTWGMKLPPPIKTFLNSYDLHGKTVVPFNTNAGSGIGSSVDTFKSLCKGCRVPQGFTTKGGVERDGILLAISGARWKEVNGEVATWLKKLAD